MFVDHGTMYGGESAFTAQSQERMKAAVMDAQNIP